MKKDTIILLIISVTIMPIIIVLNIILNITNLCNQEEKEISKEEVIEETNNQDNNVTYLYDLIKNNVISNDDFINYDLINQGNGIYEDNGYYFYRGNVNNNVIFNNMCFKIVRTTNNGTKLIYNGISNGNTCNNMYEQSIIGYSKWNEFNSYTNTLTNLTETSLYQELTNWYNNNFNKDSLVVEDDYCTNTSTLDNIDNNTLTDNMYIESNDYMYDSLNRVSKYTINTKPQMNCTTSIKSKVGLITLDETVYAGFTGGYNIKENEAVNKNNYLFSGVSYYTMSPVYFNGAVLFIGSINYHGYLDNSDLVQNIGIRPVITISKQAIITSGDGTKDNPYLVS